MLFFYRLQLFSYILRNIKDIFFKLIFISIYLYCFGMLLVSFNEGFSTAVNYSNPKNIVLHTYSYLKWWYDNSNLLTYGVVFRVILSLLIPYFIYRVFCRVKWYDLLRKLVVIFNSNSRKISQNSNKSSSEISNISQDEFNLIRKIILSDVEKLIDRRLVEIFATRNKVINEHAKVNDNQQRKEAGKSQN